MSRRAIHAIAGTLLAATVTMGMAAAAAANDGPPPNGTYKIENKRHLEGVTRVTVPHFAISFVTEDKQVVEASTDRRWGFGRKASAGVRANLNGIDPATLQRVTDRAYEDFVASLQAAGIEVVEPDAAAAQAAARPSTGNMVKFAAAPQENHSPYRAYNNNIQDVTYTPTGTELIQPKIGRSPVWAAYGAYAQETGIPAIVLNYTVNFGQVTTDTTEVRGIAGRGDASASAGWSPGLQVIWSSDFYVLQSGRNSGRLWIEKNVWSNQPIGTQDTDDFSTGSRSRRSVALNVDNAAYEEHALDVISRATDTLIEGWNTVR